jgi:hypothetical protein
MTCKCKINRPKKYHSYISPRRKKIRHKRFMERIYENALNSIVEAEDRLWLEMAKNCVFENDLSEEDDELGGTDEFSDADDEAEAQAFPEPKRFTASFTLSETEIRAFGNPKAIKKGKRV